MSRNERNASPDRLPYLWIVVTSSFFGALAGASPLAFVSADLRTIEYQDAGIIFISAWASCGTWLILARIIQRRSWLKVLAAGAVAPFLGVLVSVGGSLLLVLYMWPILIAFSLANAAVTYFLLPKRHCLGLCTECGYNLTGNTSGRCPECGAES